MSRYWWILPFLLSPAFASQSVESLIKATYKLANESSTATGVVVRHQRGETTRLYLITAAHVLSSMKGETFLLVSRELQKDKSYNRKEIQIPVRKDGKPLWIKHSKHDLGVLRLPDATKVESLPLEVLAKEPSFGPGDSVMVATFPERFEANGAGFPVVRNGIVASFPILPTETHPTFLIDATSFSGDSGAPAVLGGMTVSGSLPEIVGFVLGKHRITETLKESKYIERKIHYPLGISYAIHASYARKMITDDR